MIKLGLSPSWDNSDNRLNRASIILYYNSLTNIYDKFLFINRLYRSFLINSYSDDYKDLAIIVRWDSVFRQRNGMDCLGQVIYDVKTGNIL